MKKKIKFIPQNEQSECGLACIVMIANALGHDIDLNNARLMFEPSSRGLTLPQVISVAEALALIARPLRVEMSALPRVATPCLLHWDFNHYVVLVSVQSSRALIADPAQGLIWLTLDEVGQHFTGIAVELSKNQNFRSQTAKTSLPLRRLIGEPSLIATDATKLLVCIAIIESLALAGPLILSMIIERAGASSTVGISALSFLYFTLVIFAGVLAIMRSALVNRSTMKLLVPGADAAFRHLLSLPMRYFNSRAAAEIANRFEALALIHRGASTRLFDSLLDGLMASAMVLTLYFIFWPAGVLLTVAAVVALGLQMAGSQRLIARTADTMQKSANQSIEFFDSLRGIQTIQVHGLEGIRATRFLNFVVRTANARVREQMLVSTLAVSQRSVLLLGLLAVVTSVATTDTASQWSVGAIVLVVTYGTQAILRIERCFSVADELRSLLVYRDRVADILLAEPMQSVEGIVRPIEAVEIEVRKLSFRHSSSDPWIFENLSFKIVAGESVAITGPSGCGKSTLLKILLGLLKPSTGEILINGQPIERMRSALKKVSASVLQEDRLFNGSIAENIAMFSAHPQIGRIEEVADQAGIRRDIERMPMRYHTLVSHAGAGLSSGQIQRLLIARALYSEPKLLLLDEATSHLDLDNEAAISARLANLSMTRLIVAHRPETIIRADRKIELSSSAAVARSANLEAAG